MKNKFAKRTSLFLKDCYTLFTEVPFFNLLCKYPPVS